MTKFVVYVYADDLEELDRVLDLTKKSRMGVLQVSDLNYYQQKKFKDDQPKA